MVIEAEGLEAKDPNGKTIKIISWKINPDQSTSTRIYCIVLLYNIYCIIFILANLELLNIYVCKYLDR